MATAKKPRVQCVCSQETLDRINAYGEANGWSTSRAIDELVRARLDQLDAADGAPGVISDATPQQIAAKVGSDDEAMEKMKRVIELAKLAGVL
jgi:hypothetical protein